jgi:hypothetical protein
LVDDQTWSIGANFNVDSQGASIYPWFYSTTGRYTYVRNVMSKELNNTRDLVVYVPASFDENSLKTFRLRKYHFNLPNLPFVSNAFFNVFCQSSKVLIMHDGQNLFNASTSFAGIAWQVQDAADALIYQGLSQIVSLSIRNLNS